MKIALLGASSQIAKDLTHFFLKDKVASLYLYTRNPDLIKSTILPNNCNIKHLGNFDTLSFKFNFDAIINFVGMSDPEKIQLIGSDIFDITSHYDQIAINYIKHHPKCRYIFISSGAAYCSDFSLPASINTRTQININDFKPTDWYGVAKLYAECRHRALKDFSIIDIRLFNYFSSNQNIEGNFLISDILRSIKNNNVLKTPGNNIVRDYIHPSDFYKLITTILTSKIYNESVDAYSSATIDKFSLLNFMHDEFGLKFEFNSKECISNPTGAKQNYYSINRKAEKFGYHPTLTSIESIARESKIILDRL